MNDPLVVDPARLKAAGIALRDQVLPAPPPPISATGSESVSTAINQTLPIIESPVVDGLPDAQTAVTNTGSKIATAADMYAETDQLLGEHVGMVQFLAARDQQPAGAATEQPLRATAGPLLGAEMAGGKNDETTDKKTDTTVSASPTPSASTTPSAGATTPSAAGTANLNQLSAMTQTAQPVTQGLQSVMSSVQQVTGGMGNAGASPATLADDTKADDTKKPDESTTDDAQLADATTEDRDGAAAGRQGPGSVPVQPPIEGRPETGQSKREL
jgi:hypothetical protein